MQKKHRLKIGAHPAYPDKLNFGRKSIYLEPAKLLTALAMQLGLFKTLAQQEGIDIHHIKLHGALYNDVDDNPDLAELIAQFINQIFLGVKVIGLAGGEFGKACREIGISFLAEGFMDRAYLANGKLAPRTQEGSVYQDTAQCVTQALALALALRKPIKTIDGKAIKPMVETICLHGDNLQAINIAKALAAVFKKSGITIQ